MLIEQNGLKIPKHLLEPAFLQGIIENGLQYSDVIIQEASFVMGSKNGENYCSEIYRVRIKYLPVSDDNDKELSVIIKSMPINETNNFLEKLEVFLRERVIYLDALPRMEILFNSNVKFGAKCYHVQKEPIRTMAFEDLKSLGFEIGDRSAGFNFRHAKSIVMKLGKYHAASMLLVQRNPSITRNFPLNLFSVKAMKITETYWNFFMKSFETLIEVSTQWPGFEKISQKLKRIFDNFIEILEEQDKPRENQISVLNHGDMWVNNIMLKYNETKELVEDVVFVDYQMACYTSLGVDLNYFFNTSLSLDVYKTKTEDLLSAYYESLRETLEALHWQSKMPTLDDIKNEYRCRQFYGFCAGFGVFPLISTDPTNSSDMTVEKLADEEFGKMKRKLIFTSKHVEDFLKFSLTRLDDMQVFDKLFA